MNVDTGSIVLLNESIFERVQNPQAVDASSGKHISVFRAVY